MKQKVQWLLLGIAIGVALPVAAEFGWTDTDKLARVAASCEQILVELRGLRAELRVARVGK